MTKLMRLAVFAQAVALVAGLLAVSPVRADPMKCSGEEKTCQLTCAKAAKAALSTCLTECGFRKSACMRTGCWDNGRLRYCGLNKQ
ncbi:MAG: hypothetical protein WC670_09805 [Pseudolabrys sp.]|jgi:hypothetical protein